MSVFRFSDDIHQAFSPCIFLELVSNASCSSHSSRSTWPRPFHEFFLPRNASNSTTESPACDFNSPEEDKWPLASLASTRHLGSTLTNPTRETDSFKIERASQIITARHPYRYIFTLQSKHNSIETCGIHGLKYGETVNRLDMLPIRYGRIITYCTSQSSSLNKLNSSKISKNNWNVKFKQDNRLQ
jgi:hypothetical protein